MVEDKAEKKVYPVSACIWFTDVTYCVHGLLRIPAMFGILTAITRYRW